MGTLLRVYAQRKYILVMSSAGPKSDRLNLRIEPELRELFETAAASAKMTLSAFILSATRIHAEQQLADQVYYSVSPEQWDAFMDALEQPPREIPRLKRLLTEPSVLERSKRTKK